MIGKIFDANGNLKNWWSPNTLNQFNQKSQCFINQYNNFHEPDAGLNVTKYLSTIKINFKIYRSLRLKVIKH